MKFKDFIIYIDNVMKWEPQDIFGKKSINVAGHFKWQYKNTKLGIFMNTLPILIEIIIKFVYYIISWPLYVIVKFIWLMFIGIFFSQKWFE